MLLPENTISYLGEQELQGIEHLVLEVKDHAYFGYFNLGTLRGMSSLKVLELRAQNGVNNRWGPADAARDILRDLSSEVLEWPDWKMPEIRILQAGTGRELFVLKGREDLLPKEQD